MLTSTTVGDGVVDNKFEANVLTNGASREPMDDNQHDTRIAGTFVGNPNYN